VQNHKVGISIGSQKHNLSIVAVAALKYSLGPLVRLCVCAVRVTNNAIELFGRVQLNEPQHVKIILHRIISVVCFERIVLLLCTDRIHDEE
jgi:hypothetical protein